MGVLTGIPLGIAQVLALPPNLAARALGRDDPGAVGLGWTVTTLAGIDVEAQYTVFGSAGAVTFCALSGLVLRKVL